MRGPSASVDACGLRLNLRKSVVGLCGQHHANDATENKLTAVAHDGQSCEALAEAGREGADDLRVAEVHLCRLFQRMGTGR